jgi:hypothetical protein
MRKLVIVLVFMELTFVPPERLLVEEKWTTLFRGGCSLLEPAWRQIYIMA